MTAQIYAARLLISPRKLVLNDLGRWVQSKARNIASACGLNAWAKSSARLMCTDCAEIMEAA